VEGVTGRRLQARSKSVSSFLCRGLCGHDYHIWCDNTSYNCASVSFPYSSWVLRLGRQNKHPRRTSNPKGESPPPSSLMWTVPALIVRVKFLS